MANLASSGPWGCHHMQFDRWLELGYPKDVPAGATAQPGCPGSIRKRGAICRSESWVRSWKRMWGWAMLARSSDDASWLPFSHADMEMARIEVGQLMTKHSVHRFLILNFDQVWRNCWSLSKTPLCYKVRSLAGQRAKKAKVGSRIDKKLHSIRGARRSITVSWPDSMLT